MNADALAEATDLVRQLTRCPPGTREIIARLLPCFPDVHAAPLASVLVPHLRSVPEDPCST